MNFPTDKPADAEPSTLADFQVTDSYQAVRIGLWVMFAGYAILLPPLFILLIRRPMIPGAEMAEELLIASVAGVFAGAALVGLGLLCLLKSPQSNERAVVKKCLVAYLIAFACVFVPWFIDIRSLAIVKKIAQAYGTYFLINFFIVLGENRQNEALISSSRLLNAGYIIGLFLMFGISLLGGLLQLPSMVVYGSILMFGFCFLGLWFYTIWQAINSTKFIPRDSEDADFTR